MTSQSYLSPARFLNGGYGFPTLASTGMNAASLAATLQRASTTVNRWCNAPSQPNLYDFRGGAVSEEQHQWPFYPALLTSVGSKRVYLNQKPLKEVTGFVIQIAKNYTVTLNPATDIIVNHMEGYIEVVAISPVIAGYFPIGWNFGLYTPIVKVSYTYGWDFPVTGDTAVATDSPTLYLASHNNWDPLEPVAVYQDDVPLTSGWTANYDDGSITFAAPPTEPVTVDYVYLSPDAIPQATGIVATDLIGKSRIAARGMIGLQSLRVAEVALSQFSPAQMVTRNGVSIPVDAANLLSGYVMGTLGG